MGEEGIQGHETEERALSEEVRLRIGFEGTMTTLPKLDLGGVVFLIQEVELHEHHHGQKAEKGYAFSCIHFLYFTEDSILTALIIGFSTLTPSLSQISIELFQSHLH